MPTSSAMEGTKTSEALRRTTGRDYDEWFELLDAWGAPGRPFREISDFLTHDVSAWWAQKLIVEYEQLRGLRPAGVRPGGTFTITATKTVAVPPKGALDAFADPKIRKRWLPGVKLRRRTSQPGRSARFDLEDGTRLNVSVFAQGNAKSQVAIEHQRLADPKAAETSKSAWRERLAELKEVLEGGRNP